MEEGLNGHVKDGVNQNDEENGTKAELEDETLRMGTVAAEERLEVAVIRNGDENGKEEKSFSSSSFSSSEDEEAEVIVTEKTDDESAVVYKEEDEVSDLTVEEAAETESIPITVEVIEEDISEAVETAAEEKGYTVEEERELITTKDSQTVEADVLELADSVSDHVESAEEVLSTVVTEREVEYAEQEGTNDVLHSKEEDSNPTIGKPVNGTDVTSHKTEIPETNGNPIISISARTMQPTSWRGCCGLLEVFKRGDR